MGKIQRIVFALVSRALLTIYLSVRVTLDVVGYAQTPDDFQQLPEMLKRIFDYWVYLPGWVNLALFCFLLFLVALSHWPDLSSANEIRKLRSDLKDANDKAWGFNGGMAEFNERLSHNEAKASEAQKLNQKASEHIDKLYFEMNQKITKIAETCVSAQNEGQTAVNIAMDIQAKTGDLLALIKNIEGRLDKIEGASESENAQGSQERRKN